MTAHNTIYVACRDMTWHDMIWMGLATHSWCTVQHSIVSTLQCSTLHFCTLLVCIACNASFPTLTYPTLPYPTLPFSSFYFAPTYTPLLFILSCPLTELMTHIYHLQSPSADCLPYRHVEPKEKCKQNPFEMLKTFFLLEIKFNWS